MAGIGQPRTRIEVAASRRTLELTRAIGEEVRRLRVDSGLSGRRLAHAAGISHSTLLSLEAGAGDPTLAVVARVAGVLGCDVSFRLHPGAGPIIRDHLQVPMLEALLLVRHTRWRPSPEVAVRRPVRGVIDLVLDDDVHGTIVATEAQSQLRRIEQQVRWSHAKADALAVLRAESGPEAPVSRLLLLRSTEQTRAAVALAPQLLMAAYPGRSMDALDALTSATRPWPGATILWVRVEGGRAHLMERPPRGISVGR